MFNDKIRDEWDKIVEDNAGDMVEWIDYTIEGEQRSYPFWKQFLSGPDETYQDFLEWFEKQKAKKAKSLVGIVKPLKAEFDVDTTTKPTTASEYIIKIENNVEKLQNLPKAVKMVDKTGIVKPKDGMGTQTKVDVTDQPAPKKGTEKDLTGVVKPVKNDVKPSAPKAASKAPVAKEKLVGVVKPKSEMGTQNVPELPKGTKATGNKVNSVKPSSEMGKQREVDITDQSKPKKGTEKDLTGIVAREETFGGKAKPIDVFDASEVIEPIVSYDWRSSLLGKFKDIKIED
jgi:hypothetical protein